MPRKKSTWRQCELKLSYGAELFVIVRHRKGWFRMPVTDTVEHLLWGVANGWQDGAKSNGPKDPLRPDTRVLVRVWEDKPAENEGPR